MGERVGLSGELSAPHHMQSESMKVLGPREASVNILRLLLHTKTGLHEG